MAVPLTVAVPVTIPLIDVVLPVAFSVATWPFTVSDPLLLVVTPVTLPEA